MKILVSNDDGVHAPGLKALAEAMGEFGTTLVVAPDRNRSAASNSLTLDKPIRMNQYPNGFYAIDGTPTDCIHLALTGGLGFQADCVVAGLNAGANLGDDVIYSGTVAAAMEGRFLGMPAIAFSMVGNHISPIKYYETGALVSKKILQQCLLKPLPPNTILNINIPDLPFSELKGLQVVRLGKRHMTEGVIKTTDPRGLEAYWIGPSPKEQDEGEGTDFYAIRNGFVSITPLQVDLTHYKQLDGVQGWVNGLGL